MSSSKVGRGLPLVMLTVLSTFLLALGPSPVHASSPIVQQTNTGCKVTNCSSQTISVAFSSSVTSGDVVVVGVGLALGKSYGIFLSSVSDTRGSTYTLAISSTDGNDVAYIDYATLPSSGTDTITATLTGVATSEMSIDLYIYELSGVTACGPATTGNAGVTDGSEGSVSISAGSASFEAGAFLLGMITLENTYTLAGSDSATAGTGFTLSSQSSGSGTGYAEYATSGVSSPTTFPASIGNPGIVFWTEDGIALEPSTVACSTVQSTVVSTALTTSSPSTTATFQTMVGTTTTTLPQPPLITNTLAITTTTTGPVAGTSTTIFTSPLITSYYTTSTTPFSEITTQTGVTTTGTVASTTTTSTGTVLSTTTSGGTVTITVKDTFNVLLTNIVQELHQWADEVLQTLGFQVTATPVGQQVKQVIVTIPCIVDAPGNANACGSASAGTFSGFTAVAASSISPPPPSGLTFPDGLFSFTVSGLTPGQTVTITITLSSPLPAGTFSYWKFQSGVWTQVPSASLDSTRTIITLTLKADSSGTINDPGGPAIGTAIIPEYPFGLPLLAIFMIFAYGLIKRRTKNPKNI